MKDGSMQPRKISGPDATKTPGIPSLASRNNATASTQRTAQATQRTMQVQNFFTIADGGALRAFFDVLIPFGSETLEICRCRLIQQEDQAPWISGPVESWDENGKKRFRHLTKFPERWKARILELVLTEWEAPGGKIIGRSSEATGGERGQ